MLLFADRRKKRPRELRGIMFAFAFCCTPVPAVSAGFCSYEPATPEMVAKLAGADWQKEIASSHQGTSEKTDIFGWVDANADVGDAKAQWIMAIISMHAVDFQCHFSRGKTNGSNVRKWLLKSASQGFLPARLLLAQLYWNLPLTFETAEAFQVFGSNDTDSADLPSLVYRGLSYECGRGVLKDVDKAQSLYRAAKAKPKNKDDSLYNRTQRIAINRLYHITNDTTGIPLRYNACAVTW